jgi:hypothetical protein
MSLLPPSRSVPYTATWSAPQLCQGGIAAGKGWKSSLDMHVMLSLSKSFCT